MSKRKYKVGKIGIGPLKLKSSRFHKSKKNYERRRERTETRQLVKTPVYSGVLDSKER